MSLDEVVSRLRAKHAVALFTFSFRKAEYRSLNDIEKHVVAERRGPLGRFVRYEEFRRFERLADEVRDWKPDIVVFNKDFAYSRWLGKSIAKPVAWWLHGEIDLRINFDNARRTQQGSRNLLMRSYGKKYDTTRLVSNEPGLVEVVLCVSRAVSDALVKRFPELKTVVVQNGVNHEWFTPTWEDGNYVLSLCRFSREKNLELILESLGGASYRVIIQGIVGTGDGEKDSLRYLNQLISRVPGNVRIQMHTTDLDLLRLLQRSSLLVHPGHDEGFSQAILQAMSCGKVVVAHSSGGTPESLKGTGFLLPDDPEKWRAVVDKLMASPEIRRELGEKAQEASLEFTWERTASGIQEGLQRVILAAESSVDTRRRSKESHWGDKGESRHSRT